MNFYIYQLRVEGEDLPFYIGKSFKGSKRLIEHLSDARSLGPKGKRMKSYKIKKAWREGKRILEETLAVVGTEELAHLLETELIKKYGRRDIGTGVLCNHTDGGEGVIGQVMSAETRNKMSTSKIGNKNCVGTKRPDFAAMWMKPITSFAETGEVLKHYNSSKECVDDLGIHKAVISSCLVGRTKTARAIDGTIYRFVFGIVTNPLSPIKRGQHAGLGKVQQTTNGGEVIAEFRNSKEAGTVTGISAACIRLCIRGKTKTAGGFIWKLAV